MIAPVFRFDAAEHAYFLNDQQVPSITQLISRAGLLGDAEAYFTEESRRRGTEVHRLVAAYSLGALDLARLETPHRGYVLGLCAALDAINKAKQWDSIEVADAHPKYRFGGRIDYVGLVFGKPSVVELKTAAKAAHHQIQTALEAVLASWRYRLAPEQMQRLIVYGKPTGKFSVEKHTSAADFQTAMRLIKEFC